MVSGGTKLKTLLVNDKIRISRAMLKRRSLHVGLHVHIIIIISIIK